MRIVQRLLQTSVRGNDPLRAVKKATRHYNLGVHLAFEKDFEASSGKNHDASNTHLCEILQVATRADMSQEKKVQRDLSGVLCVTGYTVLPYSVYCYCLCLFLVFMMLRSHE